MSDESADAGSTTTEAGEAASGAGEQPGGTASEPETFDRAYVQKVRAEAAEHRTRAKRADDAEDRLRTLAIVAATSGVLADPTDLAWSDDFADDDGWPDAGKIRAAAVDLAARKPHMGRPSGDVGQGRHDDRSDEVSLSGLLRAGA